MRHENQQKLCHSGQRFLLIRNPGYSTVYWIPAVRRFGQARYDAFLVNGTAVIENIMKRLKRPATLCLWAIRMQPGLGRAKSFLNIL